jgi:hypothetical protein
VSDLDVVFRAGHVIGMAINLTAEQIERVARTLVPGNRAMVECLARFRRDLDEAMKLPYDPPARSDRR